MKNIPVSWPTLNNKEISSVTKVLKGQTAIAGETVIAELKKTKIIKKSKK